MALNDAQFKARFLQETIDTLVNLIEKTRDAKNPNDLRRLVLGDVTKLADTIIEYVNTKNSDS